MNELGLTNRPRQPTNGAMKWMMMIGLGALGLVMSGCVNVTAPDKPIVINLNINVTQEVVVRLDKDAKDLIKSNPGIF